MQGQSIKKPITIFDYDYERVTNEWLYVAISRCTDLNNVTFSDYLQINKNDKVYLDNFFSNRIDGYKKQDTLANRPLNKNNYINVTWFYNKYG